MCVNIAVIYCRELCRIILLHSKESSSHQLSCTTKPSRLATVRIGQHRVVKLLHRFWWEQKDSHRVLVQICNQLWFLPLLWCARSQVVKFCTVRSQCQNYEFEIKVLEHLTPKNWLFFFLERLLFWLLGVTLLPPNGHVWERFMFLRKDLTVSIPL